MDDKNKVNSLIEDRKEKNKKNRSKKLTALALAMPALAAALLLTACGSSDSKKETTNKSTYSNSTGSTVSYTSSDVDTSLDLDDMFTERDLSSTYDDSTAENISLNGTSASSDSDGVKISGSTITITKEGVYVVSGTLTNGSIVVEADDTAKVQIVLKNASITSNTYAAIYTKTADKVFITSAEGTSNSLTNGGSYSQQDSNNVDGVIFGKTDIVLNGNGSLNITAKLGNGVVSKDDLKITGGNISINAANKGIEANDSIRITNASIDITAGDDGIHAENDEDLSVGYIYIKDGSINITAGDDGIHGTTETLIAGGSVNVNQSYEALESDIVNIAGGKLSLVASDDGINGKSQIKISGGETNINAGGDGIDSNGTVDVSGGATYVSGATQDMNSAFDYETKANISGGIFVATGMSGMAENFTSASQGSILLSVGNQSAGTTVTVKDSSGNVILSYSPAKSYNSVLVSADSLKKGETYTVSAGSSSTSVTLSDNIYGSGGGMQGGPGGGMQGGPGRRSEM